MAVNACEAQSAARSALTVNPISPCTASFTLRHLNHCHLSNFRLLDSPPAETPHHFTKSPQHSLCAAGKTSIHANGARAIKPPNSSLLRQTNHSRLIKSLTRLTPSRLTTVISTNQLSSHQVLPLIQDSGRQKRQKQAKMSHLHC